MKKKIVLILGCVFALSFWGCGAESQSNEPQITQQESVENSEKEEIKEPNYKDYESPDGWKCQYDVDRIACNESDGVVSFVYTGDCSGTAMIEISYIKDTPTKEVLDEKIKNWNKDETTILHDRFGGGEDVMATTAMLMPKEDAPAGSGLHEYFTVVEHNGGTLLFDNVWHDDEDEMRAMQVSDCLAEVMLDTMYEAEGVGLAAPQVGILKRIVVIDVGDELGL